jgi:hypothetical protein
MTGCGKEAERGLIPRSVEHIINQINEMKTMGWAVEATYSMLEVYNESLIDLLSVSDSSGGSISTETNSNKLKIMFQNDRVVIPQLTSVAMRSECVDDALDQLQDILCKANATRTTASTAMNERSSRSHVLFMMNIQSTHLDGTILQGGLRLVDLAGSERLDRCGTSSDAQRLRETVNINKSLSCLGDVFMALGHRSSHVPFRNSKLTMLLQVPLLLSYRFLSFPHCSQDCLSGEGKTLMLVNISPTIASSHETYCSLKFAGQVNQVQLGTAKKNITITTKAPAAVVPPAPAPPVSLASGQSNSSPPPRARPVISHQSSSVISPPPVAITTTLVPSQAALSMNGNKSQFALAPAARIQHSQSMTIPPPPAAASQTVSALPSARAKRQAAFPPASAVSSSTPAAAALAQAPKRIKSAKAGGTWR